MHSMDYANSYIKMVTIITQLIRGCINYTISMGMLQLLKAPMQIIANREYAYDPIIRYHANDAIAKGLYLNAILRD